MGRFFTGLGPDARAVADSRQTKDFDDEHRAKVTALAAPDKQALSPAGRSKN